MPPIKLSHPVALGLTALTFALLAWKLNFLCDDAFISFRYTRNLVEGHGLRYNLIESPPVEGYSNLLWVLGLAPFAALDLDLGSASRLISALCGLVLCLWVCQHARRRFELDGNGTLATGLFIATLPCTALWATGGLATLPAALLLFGMYERLLGDPGRPRGIAAGLFGIGAVLIRADGFVWVALLLGAAVLLWLMDRRQDELRRQGLRTLSLVVVVTAAHFVWRHSYYGEWMPNTARVKAGFSMFRLERGADYLMQWWLTLPSVAVVLLLSLWRVPVKLRGAVLTSLLVAGAGQAYALWVGGDFMPFGRLMVATVPFLALLFAALWSRFEGGRAWAAPGIALLLVTFNVLACFDVNPVPASLRSRFHFRLNSPWQSEMAMRASMIERCAEWTQLGRALALFHSPEDSIVLSGIGAVGYYSRLQVHDRFGLVSPEILEVTVPAERASPGHDRVVSTNFFYPQHPTLGGFFFAPQHAPEGYGLPSGWSEHPISRMLRLDRHPLPRDAGFPADSELRLLVFTRWP